MGTPNVRRPVLRMNMWLPNHHKIILLCHSQISFYEASRLQLRSNWVNGFRSVRHKMIVNSALQKGTCLPKEAFFGFYSLSQTFSFPWLMVAQRQVGHVKARTFRAVFLERLRQAMELDNPDQESWALLLGLPPLPLPPEMINELPGTSANHVVEVSSTFLRDMDV